MAKLKFAFQEKYYKTHRRHLRDYVFGYFHIAAGLAASVSPLSNTMLEIPTVQKLVARLLGITEKRPVPKFRKPAILSEGKKLLSTNETLRLRTARTESQRVIFLTDAFSHYLEPETEQAAIEILFRCGYDVEMLPVIGAGAALYSKAFIEGAQKHAARLLDALQKIDPAGTAAIVGIEPPEVYFLKHEYVDLLPERSVEIDQRVKNTWLLDEFLLRSKDFQRLRVVTKQELNEGVKSFRKIYFHPHCHQRAEGLSEDGLPAGTNATLELLGACGFDVELMDTGCCGMAGTFGFEAEHYELSMKIGELRLFPMLREFSIRKETSAEIRDPKPLADLISADNFGEGRELVLSSGAACRLQIRQGTGIEAVHPMVLVANVLNESADEGK